ncbi:MAG: hypothetical protein J1D89_06005 [Agathobacter sp.]|nr:hypothetical protein [Agathobacter sp.]
MREQIRKMKKQIRQVFALVLAMCILMASAEPVEVRANTFDNAYTYYNLYGDGVKFWKSGKTDGDICYATKANLSSASTRFRTLGWKATVRNESGSILQTIYFKLGGDYLQYVDSRVVSGYEYNLYMMELSTLNKRMNAKTKEALEAGKCTITLDACMTTVKNDVVQGGMTDGGSFSGSVYTTYDGIANAAGWSESGKASLHSYFDKEVDGLFYDIKVNKTTGIKSVSGGGHYLYGTKITVSATLKKGYTFDGWQGLKSGKALDLSFYADASGTVTAYAAAIELDIVYHRNRTSLDATTAEQHVVYGEGSPVLKGATWKKDGKQPLGWALSQGATEPNFDLKAEITGAWIIKYAPQVHLYAVWEEESGSGGTPGGGGAPGSTLTPDPDPDPEPPYVPDPDPDPEPPYVPDPDPDPEPPYVPDPDPDPEPPYVPDPDRDPELPSVPDPDPEPPSDEDLPPMGSVQMRFISQRYFEDESGSLVSRSAGGLDADSRWATDLSFRFLLRQVLQTVG